MGNEGRFPLTEVSSSNSLILNNTLRTAAYNFSYFSI